MDSTGIKIRLQNVSCKRFPPHCASKACCSKPTHQASGPIIDDENIHLFINQNSLPCFLGFFCQFLFYFWYFLYSYYGFYIHVRLRMHYELVNQDGFKSFLKKVSKTFKLLKKNDNVICIKVRSKKTIENISMYYLLILIQAIIWL